MRAGPRARRCMYAVRAYLVYYAMKHPKEQREHESWAYLMEWARLGGQPDEGPWHLGSSTDGVRADSKTVDGGM